MTDHPVMVDPDLVIEIISRGSEVMDRWPEFQDFGKLGVNEYWIVSSEPGVAAQMRRLDQGRFIAADSGSVVPAGLILDMDCRRKAVV